MLVDGNDLIFEERDYRIFFISSFVQKQPSNNVQS